METATVYKYCDNVYDPSEDSFLLIDALESDLKLITELKPNICLEVGSGSGIVISSIGKVLRNSSYYMATDINYSAAELTVKTGTHNGISVEVINTDLTGAVESRLTGAVDLLLFNPPYVVTPSEEVGIMDLSAAWAGGTKGREVMDRFFPVAASLLSQEGLFYLVALKENMPEEIMETLKGLGLHVQCVLSRHCGMECLSILRSSKTKHS